MREGVRELSEFVWAVCYEEEDATTHALTTYAVESCDTEAEAWERAEKRNEDEGLEDYYFGAELEPDALDDQDIWAMKHTGTPVRII
jgi:hypothetical protein